MNILNPTRGMVRLAALFTLGTLALGAQADTYTIADSHVLHGQDTMSLARALLSDRIKQRAVEQSGQYIALQQVLTSEGFSDSSVHVLSSGLIRVIDSRESISQDDQGRRVLHLEETLSLDPDSLQRRIDALHHNHEQSLALRQLSAENERLRQQRGVLLDQPRYGDPVARARAFEQWQRDIARWRQRSVDLEGIAKAQEAIVFQNETPQEASDRLFYRLEQVRRQLQSQLQVVIIDQLVIGDRLELDVQVSGMANAQALIREALEFPLGEDGLLYPEDYRQWPAGERERFRKVLPTLAMLPLYLKVEAGHERDSMGGFVKTTRRGYFDHRYDHASVLLFGTMLYAPMQGGRDAASRVELSPALANDLALTDYFANSNTGYAGHLHKRLTLGISPPRNPNTKTDGWGPDGNARVRLHLDADRGVPPYIVAQARLGDWNNY
ncbi:hypothetical protein ACT3UJ_06630 [Halomonas sp. 86]|uniref:hypothetical protein n=1 Tax=unclassified Halomonas TaxID=2609666 RepID=UPI004033350E